MVKHETYKSEIGKFEGLQFTHTENKHFEYLYLINSGFSHEDEFMEFQEFFTRLWTF